jgi:hypothetical protein
MNPDKYNLKCALVAFLLAAFVGFAFSGGIPEGGLFGHCEPQAVHAKPPQ